MELAARGFGRFWKSRPALRWIAVTSIAAGSVVILIRTTFSEKRVLALIEWVSQQGALAPVLFVILQCLFVITLAPGFLLSFASGFLFGFWLGLLCVWSGTLLGAVCAFCLAPLTFRGKSDGIFKRFPSLRRLDQGFSKDGWKIVMLRCLVPFFPFKLSNYAFGITQVSISQFTLGTAIGIVPIAAFNVYLGSISADLSTLGANPANRSSVEWIAIALGGVTIIATLMFVTRRARAIFSGPMQEEETLCG